MAVSPWDSYPSFAFYSGNILYAEIWIDPDDYSRLPESARRALRDDGMLPVSHWSLNETGAQLYPERRIILNIGRQLARRWARNDLIVWIAGTPDIFTGERTHRYWRCPAGGGAVIEVDEQLFGKSEYIEPWRDSNAATSRPEHARPPTAPAAR